MTQNRASNGIVSNLRKDWKQEGGLKKSWQLAVVLRNAETLKKEIAWGFNCLIIHLKYKNYCQLDVN